MQFYPLHPVTVKKRREVVKKIGLDSNILKTSRYLCAGFVYGKLKNS